MSHCSRNVLRGYLELNEFNGPILRRCVRSKRIAGTQVTACNKCKTKEGGVL